MKVPFYDTINIDRVPELSDMSPEIQGKFEYLLTVREGDMAQSVYIFKFSRGEGCRDIASPLHEVLPPCTPNKVISDRELILLKGDGKLGTAYFYMNQPNKPLIEQATLPCFCTFIVSYYTLRMQLNVFQQTCKLRSANAPDCCRCLIGLAN